jgi:hypothetical protein
MGNDNLWELFIYDEAKKTIRKILHHETGRRHALQAPNGSADGGQGSALLHPCPNVLTSVLLARL